MPESGLPQTVMDIRLFKNSKTKEQSRNKLADVFTGIPKASLLPVKIIRTSAEAIPKTIRTGAEVIPKTIRAGAEVIPKTIRAGAEAIPKTIRTGAEAIPKTIRTGAVAIPQIIKAGTGVIPRKITMNGNGTISSAKSRTTTPAGNNTTALTKKYQTTPTENSSSAPTGSNASATAGSSAYATAGSNAYATAGSSASALAEANTTMLAETDLHELDLLDISNRSIPPEIREKLKLRKVREERRQLRKTKFRKKLAKGSAGTVLGLSIMLAGLFDSPADLIQQQAINNLSNNEAIEIMIDDEDIGSDEDERKQAEIAPAGKGLLKRIADAARNYIKGLPLWIKSCICIPLWGAGYGITYLISLLCTTFLSPVLSHILGFVLMAAALLAAFAVTMKCIFPDMPIKKILNRRNITIVLICTMILKILDIILPVFWPGYFRYKYLIMIIAGIALLLVTINAVRRWKNRKYRRRHVSAITDHKRNPLADEEEKAESVPVE